MSLDLSKSIEASLHAGAALVKTGGLTEAQKLFDEVIRVSPGNPAALHMLAIVASMQGRLLDAITLLNGSLSSRPDDAKAWTNLARMALMCGNLRGAAAALSIACKIEPRHEGVQQIHDQIRHYLSALGMTLEQYANRASSATPETQYVWIGIHMAAQAICDWPHLPWIADGVHQSVAQGKRLMNPFSALAYADAPAFHRETAELNARLTQKLAGIVPMRHTLRRGPRIRLAYLSADFYEHATAYLMAELFERHDRSRFEVIGVSWGPNDASPIRQRLERSFDEFWEMRDCTAVQISQRMVQGEIDIAVDLKGYTFFSRPDIFLHKPAPIVVNYLGYPGTMGWEAYDYIIGDAVVTPFEHAEYYSEHIVQMPNSYQVNDSKRAIAPQVPSREQEGLPEKGFVFAAFNNAYKIQPAFFDVWMNLLRKVPGSVLWLIGERDVARNNLRAEAQSRGIDPDRLVFARKAPLAQHLARHVHAGVLLDNLPVNAHTTASDALWAGIPVITCMGQAFAGRVAASLLTAVGLQELITHNLQDYEALALRIAQDSAYQQHLCDHLKAVRHSTSLFDASRFAVDIEAAYTHMYERWQQGLPPQAFAVANIEKS